MKTLQQLGTDLGALLELKNAAYGDSFSVSGDAMRLLYPNGVPAGRLDDALLLARIWDKMKRIATDNDPTGESPYQDIAGYGLLGVCLQQHKKESNRQCPVDSASVPDATPLSKVQRDSAPRLTSERTITSASERVERRRPQQADASSADAAAQTATGNARDVEAARRNNLHTAQSWTISQVNRRCIACDRDFGIGGTVYPLAVAITGEAAWPAASRQRVFNCDSESCRDFCMNLLRQNLVYGIGMSFISDSLRGGFGK